MIGCALRRLSRGTCSSRKTPGHHPGRLAIFTDSGSKRFTLEDVDVGPDDGVASARVCSGPILG
jgi:hypothetical protein